MSGNYVAGKLINKYLIIILKNEMSNLWMKKFNRCGETKKQRSNREVTETVFSSEVHSVRRNPTKTIIDHDTTSKTTRNNSRILNYDSLLNCNNVEYNIPKNLTDMDYGLPKNCLDYHSNNTTPAKSMAIVSDGEVVVFDDIDDNWQSLRDRLDINTTNTTKINTADKDDNQQRRIIQEPLGSSVGSSPSPTSFTRTTSDFFKVILFVNYLFIYHYHLDVLLFLIN